jgi:bla regulator protein blaR1
MPMKLSSAILCVLSVAVLTPLLNAQTHRSTYSFNTGNESQRKYNFALISRDGSMTCWGSWNTDGFKDLGRKEDALYVKKGEEMYLITDAGVLSQAQKAIEPLRALGKQQGELGREQGKLGAEQGKLGAKQGEYGRQMGMASRELTSSRREGSGKYEQTMKELSKQMQALGKQQQALGEKQKALGARQSELGRRQSDAAKEAEGKITKLIDDAFARGLAKKV